MNLTYRSIWNEKTDTCVAVSENARSAGRKISVSTRAKGAFAHFILEVLAISLISPFAPNAYALPVGGAVVAGGASISNGASSTTITQSSQNVAINWQSFSIGQGEVVRFIQPNSSSVALNRVLGADPSSILGSMSANGKVFLINPNGILFGKGAQVSVGGLVASTLNISDSDFMAGRYQFAGSSTASVLNQGTINADGGYVALLGANVGNDGTIVARLGTVALAAGNAITLDVAGDGLLNVAVNQGAVNALARNGGLVQADGGQVMLTAKAAASLLQSAVNNTGIIEAQTIENYNGIIRLLGDGQSGTVSVSGTLNASGTVAGQTGGRIEVTGHHVGLLGAKMDASGDAGGGTVLIGGDYQGKNSNVENASATYISADSTITADAITNGSGGKVVLWANDTTRAYGSFSARGGAQGGDGGLIETSGHWLDVTGIKINASAPSGKSGDWLLDPNNITIQAAGAETNVTAGPNFTSTNDNAIVTTATIQTALNAGTSVIVTTGAGGTDAQAGNIVVNDTLTWTHVAGPTLTLNAVRDVTVSVGAAITATTGSLALIAGHDINVNEAITTTTGNLAFTAGHDVNINAAMSVTTGNVVLRAGNKGTGPGAIIGGTVAITCPANCITITDLAGALSIRFNPIDYSTTNAEILAYGSKLTGGAALDAKAWVFGNALDKTYDGTPAATVSSFKPDITAALPPVALGAVSNANFDTKDVGASKLVSFDSAFSDGVFALFAPLGTPAGKGTARANITPAALGVTADNQSKTYGTAFAFAGTEFNSTGLQNGETVGSAVLTSLGAPATAHVAGSPYAITPSAATGGTFTPTNYTITYTSAPLGFTVSPAPLTVTANNQSKTYGTAVVIPGTAFTSSALQNADVIDSVTLTSLGAPATAHVAGSPYAITPSAAIGAAFAATDYAITYTAAPLGFTVSAAPLTVTANNQSKTYGTAVVIPGTAFTSTALQNADAIDSVTLTSLGTPATAHVAGSPYMITPSLAIGAAFAASDYNITYTPAPLGFTVSAAPLTVTVPVGAPSVASPIVVPPVTPLFGVPLPAASPLMLAVVLVEAPAQLLSVMPVLVLAPVPTDIPVVAQNQVPIIVPAQAPAKIYVAPIRPRKQDRN